MKRDIQMWAVTRNYGLIYVREPNVRLASPCGPISFDVFPIDHSIIVLPMYRLCSIPAASIGQMQNSSGTVYQ